jgi:cytochrome c biogenesis protein CcdA/predicted DsbA family dithiol-disulfide isomerase
MALILSGYAKGAISLGFVESDPCGFCPAPAVQAQTEPTASAAVVHMYYFFDPTCDICATVHREVLDPLVAEYGDRLAVEERSVADRSNFAMLLDLEQQLEAPVSSIPEVIIGRDVLAGDAQIRARLRERIDYHLAQGGVELPTLGQATPVLSVTPTLECNECAETHAAARTAIAAKSTPDQESQTDGDADSAAIHIAFFYQPGCDECERSEHDLAYIQEQYPQVQIHRFDVKEAAALNEYLSAKLGVPDDKHLTAPSLFVGEGYLLGDQVRSRAIETLIAPYLATGASEWWAGWEAEASEVESAITERFSSFGLVTVIGAGLLDGVNPCAFASMIFLISYLSMRKRRGRELLATGAAFTLGVFLTYLGVGFGFLKVVASLPFLNTIGKWVYGVTALLCLALAWGSIADYRKARAGRLADMSLKLPDRMRGWTKTLIREGTGAKMFVLSSFALGFGVSLVELACTGQVYLPTIIYVLGVPALRARATLSLLVYNTMFILPLIGVFLLVYFGTTSQQLIDWMTKRTAAVKLGTAVLFLLLAGWLGYSIIAL